MITGPYAIPVPGPVIYQREADNATRVLVEGADGVAVPSAATLTVLSPTGTTIATPSPTIDGSTGIVTAVVLAASLPSTLGYSEGYTEQWTLTVDGTVYTFRRPAVVARFGLFPPVTVDDVVAGEYPDLRRQMAGYAEDLPAMFAGSWAECVRYLWKNGVAPTVVADPSQAYDWFRHTALERVWRFLLSTQENTRFEALRAYHAGKAIGARDGMRLTVQPALDTALGSTNVGVAASPSVQNNWSGRLYLSGRFG